MKNRGRRYTPFWSPTKKKKRKRENDGSEHWNTARALPILLHAAPNCLPQPQTLNPQMPAPTTNTENHSKENRKSK